MGEADKAAEKMFQWLCSGKNVLLHCQFGQSRSVAFLIVFLMKYRGMDMYQAFDFINKRRRKAYLKTWEDKLKGYVKYRQKIYSELEECVPKNAQVGKQLKTLPQLTRSST